MSSWVRIHPSGTPVIRARTAAIAALEEADMTTAAPVQRCLDEQSIACQAATRPATGSSSETAQAAHISGDRIAKAVVLSDDGGYLLAVVPASQLSRAPRTGADPSCGS